MRDREQQLTEDQPRGGPGFNRRDFLRGSGAAVAATAIATEVADTVAADKPAAKKGATSGPATVELLVNGKSHKLKLEPRVTLLDALRNDLNLTGSKEVCNTTNCGACTVIIDGKPTYACSKLAVEVQGKKITTIEGLSDGKNVDQVMTAFVKHDATQCGYCTPGFVVAVRAFLNDNPKADLEKVLQGLGGNLCRCGTYVGVTAAAMECAKKGGA